VEPATEEGDSQMAFQDHDDGNTNTPNCAQSRIKGRDITKVGALLYQMNVNWQRTSSTDTKGSI
jgi:hypothetical protein